MKLRSVILPTLAMMLLAVAGSCQTQHQAILSWTAPTGTVTSYNVYRSATPGGEKFGTPLASASTTTYTDVAVTPGQSVCYTVTAVNGSNESGFSNEVCGTVPSNPNAPSALILTVK